MTKASRSLVPDEHKNNVLLPVDTPIRLLPPAGDMIPICPICGQLGETGIIEWIHHYPKYYCYTCKATFFLKIPRGQCQIETTHSVSPSICRICLYYKPQSPTERKCCYLTGFYPFPTEMTNADNAKKQANHLGY